jgi:hypothetical protein
LEKDMGDEASATGVCMSDTCSDVYAGKSAASGESHGTPI